MNEQGETPASEHLARARKALLAAKLLLENGLLEDCVSRAYYAVLHAAKAALSTVGIETDTHVGARRTFGLHLVKTGKVESEFAKILAREQEDREIGDYSANVEFKKERAEERVSEAERFLERMERYVRQSKNE